MSGPRSCGGDYRPFVAEPSMVSFDANVKAIADSIDQRDSIIAELAEALQQFVNGVETHMIDSPADDILANVTNRARKALAKARGESGQ